MAKMHSFVVTGCHAALNRTEARIGVAGDAEPVSPCPARGGAIEGQPDGGRGEVQMLGIEAEQGAVIERAGRQQQQQGAVAHAAAIPGAGGGYADQLVRCHFP